MSAIKRLFAGRRIVLPSLLVVQAFALVRNILVARLLGPEQFGIAVTFLFAQQLIEATTDTGLNKYLLQSRMGNRSAAQATVQLVAATRGFVVALLIMGLAYPVFDVIGFDYPFAPFVILAGVSLGMGLLHFDNARQQRRGVFANDSLSAVAGEAAGLAACLVALMMSRTYMVVLVGLLARSVAIALVSHLLAKRPYRLRWSPLVGPAIFTFSWPLIINGPLLFFSSQADRIFVTAVLGVRELGIYSAALLLLMMPLGLATRLLGTTFMPRLSAEFRAQAGRTVERQFRGTVLTAQLLATTGFCALGPTALTLLYGPAYRQAVLSVALIGFTQGMRFLRTWPSTMALAVGRTGNVLLSNVVRLVALPLGLVGILVGGGIAGLAVGLIVGEAIALVISLFALNCARELPWRDGMPEVGLAVAVAVVLPTALLLTSPTPAAAAVYALVVLLGALAVLHRIDPKAVPRDLSAFGW